jgi:hypothetical protein
MTNGETNGETNRENSWRIKVNRWKTLAMAAMSLAIAFGVLAGIQRIEMVRLDPSGPNWAEIMTAISPHC